MPIWEYAKQIKDAKLISSGIYLKRCVFCNTKLIVLVEDKDHSIREEESICTHTYDGQFLFNRSTTRQKLLYRHLKVKACPTCGWWTISRVYTVNDEVRGKEHYSLQGTIATLRAFDHTDITSPLEEVRSFLTAKYQVRYEIHPRVFEETVASVFRGLGYHAKVTAYSGDGGIDIILDGPDDKEIGVQVKRYRGSIDVEQIRSFTGALLIGGFTKGIFVTTSRFQSGTEKTAKLASLRGIQIELLDAKKLYDALKIAQRKFYKNKQELLTQLESVTLIQVKAWGSL